MTTSSKVFIYTIPRKSAFGIDQWVNPASGQNLNKTKIGNTKTGICALYSPKVGGLLNGLSYKEWTKDGKPVLASNGTVLTLQHREEQKWNLSDGFLTNKAWRKGDSLDPEKMTYFQTKTWKIKDGATVLDLTHFDDAMLYHVALDHKMIANSEREHKARKWPYATHYIAITNESEEIIHERNLRKVKAYAALADKNITYSRKKDLVHILKIRTSNSPLSDEMADNDLFRYIDGDTITNPTVDKFMELINLLKDEKGRMEFAAKLLIQKALDARVIYEKADTYTWNRSQGAIVLGDKYSDAIDFFLNPKKESLVTELEQEVKAKLL